MFLNESHIVGRSGISRLMFTSLIVLIMVVMGANLATAQEDAVLRVGLPPVETLDPALGTNDPEVLFNTQIYDNLIDTMPDNTLVPNLATDWEISEDGLTYTFTLADGVTFHDGSALISADVVYTYERLVAVESSAVNLLGEFEVSAPDDQTVVFTLPAVNADFLYGIASRFAVILDDAIPSDQVNVVAEGDAPYANFNGTGPFVLTEYNAGVSASLVANENYFKEGQPMLDGIEFIYDGNSESRLNLLRDGGLDFIFKIGVFEVPAIEGVDGITVIEQPTNQHPVVRIRSDEGSLGEDVRIRQAFKHATNRDELLDFVQEGYGVIGNNDPIGPAYGDFYTPVEGPEFNPERACELVTEVTGEDRISIDFYVSLDFPNYPDLGLALRDQWSQGCIDVEVLERDAGLYYGNGEWLEVDLGITGWGDRPIPSGYLNSAYASDGAFNETHWSDAELDELIAQASMTTDTAARAEIYAQISEIFAERGPIIIPWFSSIIGATSDRVDGLVMAPFPGETDFRTVSISE